MHRHEGAPAAQEAGQQCMGDGEGVAAREHGKPDARDRDGFDVREEGGQAVPTQEVAQGATRTAEATQEARELVKEGQRVVDHNTDSIEALAEEVQHAARVVSQAEADSEEIGGVLDVIRGIAEDLASSDHRP